MSEKMGPIISTNGLVFCVDAANPQSIVSGQTIWKDLTFNTTGGTLVNGVGFSGSGISSALSFDGTDDFVRISSDQPFTPTNGFSVTSWVNPTDITFQRYTEITRRQGGGGLPTYLLSFQEYGDIISFGLKTTSTYNELDIQIKSGGTNTWTSYIGTWDGTNKRLYRNGSNIGQNAQIGTISDDSGSITNIGSLPNLNSEYFRGRISQVQMYNRGLSPFEVYQNYNAIKSRYGIPDIVTGGLVLNLDAGNPYSYNPDNTGSTVWTDVSYTSTGGTLVNGTYYTGGTMTFDGVDDYVDTTYTASTGNNFSFGAVCKPTDVGQSLGSDIIAKNYSSDNPYVSWGVDFLSDRTFRLTVADGSNFSFITSTPQTLNQIYYLFVTYQNKVLTAYINGAVIGTKTNTDDPVYNNQTISLGVWKGSPPNNYFVGNIYLGQVYNRALSTTEVQQNFNALRGRYGI
jgi:hypothetical protein